MIFYSPIVAALLNKKASVAVRVCQNVKDVFEVNKIINCKTEIGVYN